MRNWTRKQRDIIAATLFLIPGFLLYLSFFVYPLIFCFYTSSFRWTTVVKGNFIGIANFIKMAREPLFWNALWNSVYLTVGTIPAYVVLSLLLAIIINQRIKGIGIFRTCYYIPVITSLVAVAIIWIWLYDYRYGLFNTMLAKVGLPRGTWLKRENTAMPSLILMLIWKRVGFFMVLYLAGLQGISETYYESARIDGANKWQCLIYITVPLLRPVIFVVIIMSCIMTWREFTSIYVMTDGGPLHSTEVLVYYLYDVGFNSYKMGYGSAVAVVMFVILLTFTLSQWRLRKAAQ